jgi:hypothetical protein
VWVAAVAFALLMTAAGSAAAAGTNRCVRWAKKYDLTVRGRSGLVFSKTVGESGADTSYFGCLYSRQRAYWLVGAVQVVPRHDPRFPVQGAVIAGRYVAYWTTVWNDALAGATMGLAVRDLKTGKVVIARGDYVHRGVDTQLCYPQAISRDMVLRGDGALAWTAGSVGVDCQTQHDPRFTWEVLTISKPGGRIRSLDVGADIDPHSLRKSAGGHLLKWRHGADVRTAPFGP